TCLPAYLDRWCGPVAVKPLWSPDGRWLTFAAEDRGALSIYRVEAAGGATPATIVSGERLVTGLSVSGDGQLLAFTATDPINPAEVFVAGSDGNGERRLSHLNQQWLEPVDLSPPQHF